MLSRFGHVAVVNENNMYIFGGWNVITKYFYI